MAGGHVQDGSERQALLSPGEDIEEGDFKPTTPGFFQKLFAPGSILTSVFTLCAMSLGVGVFVLPQVFMEMGLIAGIVSILFFAYWSYWLQIVLVRCAKGYGVSSYEALAEASLGPAGKYTLAFFTAVTNLLANSAHMKTAVLMLNDQLTLYVTGAYAKKDMTATKEVILYIPLLVGAFLCCTGGKISELRFVSSASVTIVLTLCVWTTGEALFWYMPGGTTAFKGNNSVIYASDDWEVYAVHLPDVAFAFTSTFMLFPVFKEMSDQSDRAVRKAVGASTWICGIGYMVLAVVGVLTFGNEVGKNVVTGEKASTYIYVFPDNHYVIVFLAFFLAIALTMLYAIINFPFIIAVETILSLVPTSRPIFSTPVRHSIITLVGMVVLVLINLAFSNLVTLFGLCGGWGVTFIVYAIPSAIALGAGTHADPKWAGSAGDTAHRVCLGLSLVLVLIIAIGFTYVAFK